MSPIAFLRIVGAGMAFVTVTAALLPVHLVALRLDRPLARRIPRLWHRLMAPVIGLRVRVSGELDPARPLMLVTNHASWLDIVALGSLADVAFIAKAEVRDWPVFGMLARWQRSVFVDRDVRRSTATQIDAVAKRLDRGEIVVLFAEGTTTDGNRVLPFKSSLLGAAKAAALRSGDGSIVVQPAAIAYTRIHGLPMGRRHRHLAAWPGDIELAPHLFTILKEGAIDVEIRFGRPASFDAETDRKHLARRLRGEVEEMLLSVLRPD